MKKEASFRIPSLPGCYLGMLFDLDDTLIDRCSAFRAWAWASVPKWLGSAASEETVARAVHLLISLDDDGFTARSELFAEVKHRLASTDDTIETMIESYYREILDHIELADGASALLEALDQLTIPFGIVTNGGPHQMDKAAKTGLTDRASCVIVSESIGFRKPDRKIFAAAAAGMKVPPEELVFVGDQPAIDVVGAHACGMRTIWLRNGQTWPIVLPSTSMDLAVDSLTEIVVSRCVSPRKHLEGTG
jgi:putative hydrolase of the HAD superfamily